ncbi:hypothetical protein B1R32_1413 [Abditibacterium utsteinense]|uniref:Uncharacterized protein n=1 Tax=Abditibacterium utsteinense TaxID=1960156 RepID=A0A2S8SNM3_9BACT|nr:hypothetical protein B1R32_1413 [Abditibacterium utsteinense]
MPVLTKRQVVEAAFELLPEEREEVAERILSDGFELSEEQKTRRAAVSQTTGTILPLRFRARN